MKLLWIYQALHYLLTPLLKAWTYFRLLRGKEDRTRFRERFGHTRLSRPEGKIFWFHGASNGECLSFLSLIRRYQEEFPDAHFLITSQTLTSSELLKSKMPKRAMHQFIPLDNPWFVKRFLNHWKPDVAFWTESELWPLMIVKAARRMPLVLLNGRLSDSSFKTWQWLPRSAKELLSSFTLIFSQSPKDLKKFKNLGAKNVVDAGNLKFSGRPLEANGEKLKELQQTLKGRPTWTASCTHPGEEEIVIEAHNLLKKTFKNIVTIVVPRHPHRADKLRQTWEADSLKVAQRSMQEDLKANTDILLFDVTGELGLIYRACPITLVGGSLIEGIGGHNPLEAANLKSAICVGPYVKNNKEIYDIFQKEDLCTVVKDAKTISHTVLGLLNDTRARDTLIKKSYALASKQQDVLDAVVMHIDKAGVLS